MYRSTDKFRTRKHSFQRTTESGIIGCFDNDSLWARTFAQQTQPVKKFGKPHKTKSKKNKVTNPDLLPVSSTITSLLPFPNDINLGSNSDSDVYVQFLQRNNGC
jgi:hypothetical protein